MLLAMPVISLRETDQASIRQLFLAGFDSDGFPLPRPVLMTLYRLIPCDVIGVGEVDPAGYLVYGMALPDRAGADRGLWGCDGPVPTTLQHVAVLAPDGAEALSNGARGVRDRLRIGFSLVGSHHVIELCLERQQPMFSERDVAMLAMLEPALHRIVLAQPRSSPRCLSGAERRVLELVAAGGSNQDVATRLCVTVATVRKHLEHVYRKLGVTNRTAAVAAVADHRAMSGG
jgi:DNA-binding CsgD family transcriptional regulator